jgi:hypothetical protein
VTVEKQATVVLVEYRTAMERIDDETIARIVGMEVLKHAYEKVAGEVNPFSTQTRTPGDLDVHKA